MRELIRSFFRESVRLALGVAVCASVVASVAYAVNLSEPTATAPAGNMAPPVNVGIEYQEKTGDFWADSVGSTDGFCIGPSCITEWPAAVSGSTCQLNTMIREDRRPLSMGTGCSLTSQEAADGWTLVSWDECSSVRSSDCAWPYYCTYQQVACTGSVTIEPGVVTQSDYVPPYAQGSYDPGCFAGDTLVLMADGTLKPISAVRVGDNVMGEDEVTGQRVVNLVTKHWIHRDQYDTLLINKSIVVTPDHKFKVLREGISVWLPAGQIRRGDSLVGVLSITPVASVEHNGMHDTVYNLTTYPSHTYFAGGVLVHNVKDGGEDQTVTQ